MDLLSAIGAAASIAQLTGLAKAVIVDIWGPGFGESCRLVLVRRGGVQGSRSGGCEVPVRSPPRYSRVGVLGSEGPVRMGSGFWVLEVRLRQVLGVESSKFTPSR